MVKRMENSVIEHFPQREENGRVSRGDGVKFERSRRITGYLVGTVDRVNDAQRAEVRNRVKHVVMR